MDNSFLHSKRLLLVDDEQELLKMVTDILKDAGFETILTAMSVKDAVLTAKNANPEFNCFGCYAAGWGRLRSDAAAPYLHQCADHFLNSKGRSDRQIIRIRAGADDYISKPFMPQELVLRIYAVITSNL